MYGQKQILQCFFVVLMMTILNFYRSAIKQNRDIMKLNPKLRGKTTTHLNIMSYNNVDPNIINFCSKNPFGLFVRIECKYGFNKICYDKFEMWTKRQCEQYCCKREKMPFIQNANERRKFEERSNNEKPLHSTRKSELVSSTTIQSKEFLRRDTTSSILDIITLKHTEAYVVPDENIPATETERENLLKVRSRGEKIILF